MRDQPFPIELEFVLLCLAAKNRMIFQDQTAFLRAGLPLKDESGSESADTAAHYDAVVDFAGVDGVRRKRHVSPITHFGAGKQGLQRISVRCAVFPDAAVPGEVVLRAHQLRWR